VENHNYEETLNRTVKIAIDSGEASTLEDAVKIFEGYHLAIEVGSNVATSPTLQACLLSVVNAGRRAFLGGVSVGGSLGFNLLIPWKKCKSIEEAIIDLRGSVVKTVPYDHPRIIIGDVSNPLGTGFFAVRATFDGWVGGVVPVDDGRRLPEKQEFTPSGVLAGALAVSEAFQHIRGGNPMAGRRAIGLSLWRPEPGISWLDCVEIGPQLNHLPSKLWLIGLGHLGQAFLWTLGFLPYAHPNDVSLVLQDVDVLSDANDSTSPLTFAPVQKEKKTRVIAKWCEERGFRTSIHERLFAADFNVTHDEPIVGICGVDNAMARSALENVGFSRVIEAGLGKGEEGYLAFQVHTFPGEDSAKDRWGISSNYHQEPTVDIKPAYKALSQRGFDKCGIARLAGRSVGACFVGMVASAIMVAELLRMAIGAHAYSLIDGTLRSLDHRTAIANKRWTEEALNPGITCIQDERNHQPSLYNS
jgi:hypothetical protein